MISLKIDWLDLLAVQGTLKSLLQHHSSKGHQFFGALLTLTTIRDHWEDHSLDSMDLCWQSDISDFQHTVSRFVIDFLFLGSEITADGDCSHEIKSHLLLGRKDVTNLDSILKSRDITLPKGPSSQSYGFPVVMYGCESWTIKKAERQRIDAFELQCWRRLLRVP